MRQREQRLADLVIVGHVGFATDRTVNGSVSYVGGSGFVVAFAASALLDGVGLVAQVGEDFDLDVLRRLPIDMEGIAVQAGTSARLRVDQASDGTISFGSDLGIAAEPSFDRYPAAYLHARYVHLGTAPPRQQLAWLKYLRDQGCHAQVSVDMFEPFVAAEPDACHEVCDRADLIFLNDAEHRDLYGGRADPPAPAVLKHGPGGAEFLANGGRHRIPAPEAGEVDPIGAGEVLAGSFLALRARGLAADQALTYAVAAATRSVTEFGVPGPAVTGELKRVRDELGSAFLVRDVPVGGFGRVAELSGVAEFGGAAPGGDQAAFGPELLSPGPAQRGQPAAKAELLGKLAVAAGSLGRELFGGTHG